MGNRKTIKNVMKNQSSVVRFIINKSLQIEDKYTNRVVERDDVVDEIISMIKNEVK